MAKSTQEIASLLKNTRFRRCVFGGIDEDEVWAQYERLNREYAELLETRQQRAKGAVSTWREYALQLETELRKKDEQLRLLNAAQGQPRAAAVTGSKASAQQEGTPRSPSGTARKDIRTQRDNQVRHIYSAEQIRSMYSGKGGGSVNCYG
jgi:hypothetical protein